MKNIIVSLFICLAFSVIKINQDKITVYVPGEYLTGTDTACEEYITELKSLLRLYKQVNIVNSGWLPSNKTVRRGDI